MDELEAVGDPALRNALLFVRSRGRAVTADELAAAEAIHRNVARTRLERLASAGLLEASFERRTGRVGPGAGRPAKTYTAAPSLAPIEFPERRSESLLALLIEALPDGSRAERLRAAGVAFGHELATAARLGRFRSPQRAFEAVCRALAALGYQATLEGLDERQAVIATATCPVRPVVRAHEDAAEIDRGMWAGLVEHALGSNAPQVVCNAVGCRENGSCRVFISF